MIENNDLNEQVIQWGCQYLKSHGYTLHSHLPEKVQIRPWSYVVRFATSDGYIYLKRTPELIALEAIITRVLYDEFHAPVPDIIAHNPSLHCFLMKDAGRSLRDILKNKFDANLLCKAIDEYTSLQFTVAKYLDVFLDIGVPDWRLDKLPDLFSQLLLEKDMLMADGLSEMEISKLKTLHATISSLCKKLSSYSIHQTIIQPDFHDNNLLVNELTKTITIIDLGEIVISHPFFSLINLLHQMKKHHALTEHDDAYLQILDACFKNYLDAETKENLLDAFATAEILLIVYGALANARLMKACGIDNLRSFQPGRLSGELRELLGCISV